MSNKTPIFPILEPQHFSDYGFDSQIDYFQVMEEARKHKRESTSKSIDMRFRLQKPVPKDDSSKKIKKNKKRWWRNAFLFFKRSPPGREVATAARIGPVYATESRSGSSTPYRSSGRSGSGPLMKGEVGIPYVSLKELNMNQQHRSMPLYLVT